MKNIGQLMKQAQAMQAKMAEAQEELAQHQETGQAGGGLVTVSLTGKGEMASLKIDPSLMKEGEAEILEDLLVAAFNDAKKKVETYTADKMSNVTGGLSIPGLS